MNIHLSKQDASLIFALAIHERANCPCDISPNFETETLYAEYLFAYIIELPVDDNTDIITIATEKFNNNLISSYKGICQVLDKYQVDGTKIFEIISKEKLIPRKDRSSYNRQLPEKYPKAKGIKKTEWENYNHWVLVNAYWQGFLWSQQPDFKIILPPDANGPMEFFLADEMKVLWGMKMKAREAGLEAS